MHIPDATEVTQHCENKNQLLLGREEEERTKIGNFSGKEDGEIERLVSECEQRATIWYRGSHPGGQGPL